MGKIYKPKNKKRARKHGFLVRMRTTTGTRTITKRRRKGRKLLSKAKA